MPFRTLALSLVALTALTGCASSSTASGATPSLNQYASEIQKNFLASCEKNGGTAATCGCVLGEMELRFTQDQFVSIDQAASGGASAVPSDVYAYMQEAATACRRVG